VVVDDAAMAIDLVLRGDDHLSNTPKQVLLFEALGYPLPEFAHLPMVRGEDGSRLSKRHGAVSVGEYRRAGYPVAGMLNALALLGWAPKDDQTIVDLAEMVDQFEIERVNRSPAAFDADKLDWICNQHIQRMTVEDLADPVARALAAASRIPEGATEDPRFREWFVGVAGLVQSALKHYDQAPERASALYHPGGAPLDQESIEAVSSEDGRRVVAELA
jgi:glutamyl/glutaminyl-tRNA synthetase